MNNKNNTAVEVDPEVLHTYHVLGYDSFMARVMALNYKAAQVAKANLAASPYRH